MAEVPDTVDDAIGELSDTPTTDEVFYKTLPFQGREIASAAVSMAAAGGGGGGGSLPAGGSTGQLLAKASNADGDANWATVAAPSSTRAQYSGDPSTVANFDNGSVTWNVRSSGTALLSLTAPALPTVVTAGVYAISVTVVPVAPLTAGGYFNMLLEIDPDTEDAGITAQSPTATSDAPTPIVGLTLTGYCPAGGGVKITVSNFDGVASRDFQLSVACVQRLS